MWRATETSSQPAANMPLPRQSGGAKPMACSNPSRRSHRSASAAPAACQLLGRGDVDLEHFGLAGKLSGRSLGQRQGPTGTGEDDLGPFLLGQLGHGEGQRGIGEHAGDEESLAIEESHCARRLCESRGVHVGIIGGTGPAGRGVAVRLAQAGVRVTLGSRDAERAATMAAEVVAHWPALTSPSAGQTTRAPPRRTRGPGHAVGQRHPDRAGRCASRSRRQGRRLHGQCAGEGGPRDAGPGAPRGSMAAAVQAALPRSWSPPPSTTCRPRKWRTWNRGWKLMCWCAPTMPRRRRHTLRVDRADAGPAPAGRREPEPGRRH